VPFGRHKNPVGDQAADCRNVDGRLRKLKNHMMLEVAKVFHEKTHPFGISIDFGARAMQNDTSSNQ
tara:strand:+ start:488 stop:685 length:198 start_codon:yes stop_codon:yes gene_type:complete